MGLMFSQQVRVIGVKDFVDDGDQRFRVVVGPCKSADVRFDNIGDNLQSSATFTNLDVPFPLIERVECKRAPRGRCVPDCDVDLQ